MMGRIEELAAKYEDHASAPWTRMAAGAQRVTLLVYEKELERTLRARLAEFEQATTRADHEWRLVDCTPWFAEWMSAAEYLESYFEEPSHLGMQLRTEFRERSAQRLRAELQAADDTTVVALLGVASLFGFLRVSELIHDSEDAIRGRLLVFFPGTKDENNYRLLDARDGWNYLAHAITIHGGGVRP